MPVVEKLERQKPAENANSATLPQSIDVGSKILLTLTHDTKFKSSDQDSSADLSAPVCAVASGQSFKAVVQVVRPETQHFQVQFDPILSGCPNALNASSWVFWGHVRVELQAKVEASK